MKLEENNILTVGHFGDTWLTQMNFNTPIPTEAQLLTAYPNLFTDNAVALQFLIDHEIVAIPVRCSTCLVGNMLPVNHSPYQYYCTRHGCKASRSILKGCFFSNCHGLAARLKLMYCILAEMKSKTITILTGCDRDTIMVWTAYLHELMAIDEQSLPDEDRMMGGPDWIEGADAIVEMDESKFAKIKYGYGHPVAAGWVFGFIERKRGHIPGKFVAFAVENRDAETLEAIYSQYIRPGSAVYTDMWKGYRTWVMNQMAVTHRTVNHSLFYKDPLTQVHTNTIEGMWNAVKKTVPPQCRTAAQLQPYLWNFVWRRRNKAQLWNRLMFLFRVVRYDGVGGAAVPPVQVHVPLPPPVEEEEEVNEDAWEDMCVIN